MHETNDEWDDGLKEEDEEEEKEKENESKRNQSPAARSYARRVHAKKKAEVERAAREAKGEIEARNPNGVKNGIKGLMQGGWTSWIHLFGAGSGEKVRRREGGTGRTIG